MGKEGKQPGKDVRRRRGKEAAMEEEDDAAPPTGCWIRLPRLGGGCMSSGSKVDSSTSGACGNGGGGKMLPLLLHIASTSLSASLHSSMGSCLMLVCTFDWLLVCSVSAYTWVHGRVRIVFERSRWRSLDFFFYSTSFKLGRWRREHCMMKLHVCWCTLRSLVGGRI